MIITVVTTSGIDTCEYAVEFKQKYASCVCSVTLSSKVQGIYLLKHRAVTVNIWPVVLASLPQWTFPCCYPQAGLIEWLDPWPFQKRADTDTSLCYHRVALSWGWYLNFVCMYIAWCKAGHRKVFCWVRHLLSMIGALWWLLLLCCTVWKQECDWAPLALLSFQSHWEMSTIYTAQCPGCGPASFCCLWCRFESCVPVWA